MDALSLTLVALVAAFILKTRDQRRRIGLLARHLSRYKIEPLMERLSQAYLRALAEDDPGRRDHIWQLQQATEAELSSQFGRFAAGLAEEREVDTRVSRIPLPYADRWWPLARFDLREAMRLHARAIAAAVENRSQRPARERAYTLLAELLLMQHTCHWFCRSRAVASARLLARHQTTYAQVLASVAPETRQAYTSLVQSGLNRSRPT